MRTELGQEWEQSKAAATLNGLAPRLGAASESARLAFTRSPPATSKDKRPGSRVVVPCRVVLLLVLDGGANNARGHHRLINKKSLPHKPDFLLHPLVQRSSVALCRQAVRHNKLPPGSISAGADDKRWARDKGRSSRAAGRPLWGAKIQPTFAATLICACSRGQCKQRGRARAPLFAHERTRVAPIAAPLGVVPFAATIGCQNSPLTNGQYFAWYRRRP